MKFFIHHTCLLSIFISLTAVTHPAYEDLRSLHVDFDTSMQTEKYPRAKHPSNQTALTFFKELYARTNLSVVTFREHLTIPIIIHHVWLGSKLPERYEQFRQSWINLHPAWTFVLWTDNAANYHYGHVVHSFEEFQQALQEKKEKFLVVETQHLEYPNKTLFKKSKNYGERSDILRYEVLYRFGGLYSDTDQECLRSFDALHHAYDFYIGIQPLDVGTAVLGTGLIGCAPGHPVMKHVIDTIKLHSSTLRVVFRTGPFHVMESFMQLAGTSTLIDCAFPATYFYPCKYKDKKHSSAIQTASESFAIHHWEGSWLKKSGYVQHH
jgi:mannosyltransferase OCH1-like enzyme